MAIRCKYKKYLANRKFFANFMAQFPTMVLKSGRERSLKRRHPWIFSGAVKVAPQAQSGDIVEVQSNKGECLGYGHFTPKATLTCRMFHFGPLSGEIDAGFWMQKLSSALNFRRDILDLPNTTGYRLVHAEGDGLPGIVLDIYGSAASLQLRSKGAEKILPEIQGFLEEHLQTQHLFVRSGSKKEPVQKWVQGGVEKIDFEEYGLKFRVDIERGQKTGFFIDQRENRALVRSYSKGKTVLNAFSYSGAFSIAALAGGAKSVDSVDISSSAISQAEEHVQMNFGPLDHHAGIVADCFEYLKTMERDHYDLIILDPPAFTKHISTVDKASRGYKEINLKALRKIRSGGLLFTYSCSQHISKDLFRKIIFGAAADAGREVQVVCQMEQSPDHPVSIFHPEGEYLKGLMLHVR